MAGMTRRNIVLALVGAATGISGCLSFSEYETRLGEVEVENSDTEPHTVQVLISRSGDPVYWRSKHVRGSENDVVEQIRFEDVPKEVENHVLHVRLDDEPLSESKTFRFDRYDVSCLLISVNIDEEGEQVIYYSTEEPRRCRDSARGTRNISS